MAQILHFYLPNLAAQLRGKGLDLSGSTQPSKSSWEVCWFPSSSKTPNSLRGSFSAFPSLPSAFFPPHPRPWTGPPGEGGRSPPNTPHHLKLSLSIPFLDRIHFLTCWQGKSLFSYLASPPRSLLGHTWHNPLNWQFGLSVSIPSCVCGGW